VPTIRANGLDIAYDVHGAGPPLVLLHGATSLGRSDFAAQIPLFSRAFHLFVPDAHAPLPALAVRYRLPDPATDLDAYLGHALLGSVLGDGEAARLQRRLVPADGLVTDFREKPSQQLSVSTGIYCMSPSVFAYIPPTGAFGFDHLLAAMLGRGAAVGVHEHLGSWIDIGRVEDLRKAQEQAAHPFVPDELV